MGKLYLYQNESQIDEIVWFNQDGDEESISEGELSIIFSDSCGQMCSFYFSDIPKLFDALNKAKELGWWK